MATTSWVPTMNLRNRIEWTSDERTQLVLQQQWVREYDDCGYITNEAEWRDVPTAKS